MITESEWEELDGLLEAYHIAILEHERDNHSDETYKAQCEAYDAIAKWARGGS